MSSYLSLSACSKCSARGRGEGNSHLCPGISKAWDTSLHLHTVHTCAFLSEGLLWVGGGTESRVGLGTLRASCYTHHGWSAVGRWKGVGCREGFCCLLRSPPVGGGKLVVGSGGQAARSQPNRLNSAHGHCLCQRGPFRAPVQEDGIFEHQNKKRVHIFP